MAFDPEAYAKGDAPAAATSTFDPAAYAAGGSEAPVSREKEIRAERLRALLATGQMTPRTSGIRAYTNRLTDAITSGVARPIGGAMSVATGELGELFGGKPATVGERWRGGVGAEEDYAKEMEKRSSGVVGTGVSLVGNLAGAGKATKALGLGKEMVRAGAQGAIEGASRNAESVGNAATGAATGGVVGAGTTGIVGALLDRLKRVGGAARDIGEASRGGTMLSKAEEASAIFNKLDNAGIHFGGRETPALANGVNAATSGPLPASVRGEIREVVENVNRRVANGAMTFGDVRAIQSDISKLRAHDSSDVRRVAKEMGNAVDDFLQNAKPTMPASSVGKVGPGDLDEARKLYATSKHMGKIEGIAEAAGSDPKATSNAFKSYQDKFIKNPDKFNPNDPAQKRLINEVVETGRSDVGKGPIDRWSNNLMGYGSVAGAGGLGAALGLGDKDIHGVSSGAGGAGATMLGLGLLGKGTGMAMRQQLARNTASKVDDLLRNIATGSTAQAPGAYTPRNALAILMAKQDLARSAGKAVTSNIDME